jgi:hypothetical protein
MTWRALKEFALATLFVGGAMLLLVYCLFQPQP